MASKAQVNGNITPGERRELRTIVKARFGILQEQVHHRRIEVHNELADMLDAEYKQRLAEYKPRIEAEIQKILDAIDAIEEIKKEATNVGVGVPSTASLRSYAAARSDYTPYIQDYEQKLDKLAKTLGVDASSTALNLKLEELNYLEELSLGALTTPEAKAYVESIPTVDSLIPLPSSMKAIN